jgi:hypothetical protein
MNKIALNKIFLNKIALGTATALVAFGALGGATAADATTRTHTIKGHLIESSDWGWSTGYVSIDNDLNAKNHPFASDVTTCRAPSPTATKATCEAAIAFKKGLVVVKFVESTKPGPIHGRIVAGTGRYHGATGTVTIREGDNTDDGPPTGP